MQFRENSGTGNAGRELGDTEPMQGRIPAQAREGWEPAVLYDRYRPRYFLAGALFVLTLFATTTLGAGWYLSTRTDVTTDLVPLLGPQTISRVWSDPALLSIGLAFSVPLIVILLCHELGHYLACRYYRLPATLPYFIPAPLALGTLGAFIRIRAPIRTKKELLDVGIAGPLAGFAALLPFLLYGIAASQPASLRQVDAAVAEVVLVLPGKSLAVEMATWMFHGPLPEGMILDLHPFALAAWVGLLATALNLLPLGQLDGGHILYASVGRLQRRLAMPLWVGLGLAGLFLWRGWLLWCVIALAMGLHHPPVRDESQPLDAVRLRLAIAALVLFVLCFMPVPIAVIPVQ